MKKKQLNNEELGQQHPPTPVMERPKKNLFHSLPHVIHPVKECVKQTPQSPTSQKVEGEEQG